MIILNEKAPVSCESFSDRFCSRDILFFDRVSSTDIVANNLAKKGLRAAVVSSAQFAGRGRFGRKWESDSGGGLCMSFTLLREPEESVVPLVGIAAALAVSDSLRRYADLDFRIKWPNDIVLNGKKICGVISKAAWGSEEPEYIVVGTGVNVNQRYGDFSVPLRKSATSLFIETGEIFPVRALAYDILKTFDELFYNLQKNGAPPLIARYREKCRTVGGSVSIIDGGEEIFRGKAIGIDEDGSLIVRDPSGRVEKFNYGEVSSREI